MTLPHNTTGKMCEAPGCDRIARSNAAAYCDTHYLRLRRGVADPLRPLTLQACRECGNLTTRLGSKFCSGLCSERAARGTPPEKQRGRKPPIAMVEAEVRVWRDLSDFPDYEISNDGRLRRKTGGSNSRAGRLIRPSGGTAGYPQYGLTNSLGQRIHLTAHRLVALAFLPKPEPGCDFVLHKNDDRLDARDTNLRWGTPQQNATDALRNGRMAVGDLHPSRAQPWTRPRGDGHTWAKLTEDQVRIILASPENAQTLADRYEVSPDAISRIRRGRVWRHITDPAYGAELIDGASSFASPKPKRGRLTTRMRFALLKRENYRCHLCTGLIYPGQGWDVSHEIPIELGGPDDDTNRRAAHRKCHREHTAKVDIPAIAKAKRIEAGHVGAKVSRRPMRFGRNDVLKRKLDGTIVDRATGEPISQRNAATSELRKT